MELIFRCFCNPSLLPGKKQWNGIPVGTLLIKEDMPLEDNPFREVIEEIESQEILEEDVI